MHEQNCQTVTEMSHLPNGNAQVASTAVTGGRTAASGSRTATTGSRTAARGGNSESGIVRTFAEDAQEKLSQTAKRR